MSIDRMSKYLDRVESHWQDHHYEYQFHLGVALETGQGVFTHVLQVFRVEKLDHKQNQFDLSMM